MGMGAVVPEGAVKRPKPPGRKRDREYMLAVKRMPCCAPSGVPVSCFGPVQADHAGRRPVGRKCDDRETIPLCAKHHRQRTDYTGIFGGWDAERMRAWCDERIAETQAAYERGLAGDGPSLW